MSGAEEQAVKGAKTFVERLGEARKTVGDAFAKGLEGEAAVKDAAGAKSVLHDVIGHAADAKVELSEGFSKVLAQGERLGMKSVWATALCGAVVGIAARELLRSNPNKGQEIG